MAAGSVGRMYHEPLPPERVLARRRAIGDRIRQARVQASFTQEQVSHRTDIRISTISEIENGHRSPRLDSLIRIADAIGVPLADLVRE